MLHVENLTASIGGTPILKGLDLTVGAGEVHAIMGPNGSGKSTLAHSLAGRDGYEIGGTATLDGADLPLSLIRFSEPTRLGMIAYAVFCLKKKK